MDFAAVLIAILLISMFFVARFKMNASAAPLFSICLITLFFIFTGMAGLLRYSVWAVYAFALFSPIYLFAIKKISATKALSGLFKPGVVFFIGACVFFYIAFTVKTPYFRIWDEFTFWGPAAKITHYSRELYTLVDSSIISTSYQPLLPVFSFFVQSLSPVFAEWKVYLAYNMLMMACMTLVFSRIEWKNGFAFVTSTIFMLCCLYTFWWSYEGTVLYCSAYADIPLGVMFGGALLMHFHSDSQGLSKYLPVAVVLTALPMIKDMGLALGLIAAGVIAVDMFISAAHPVIKTPGRSSRWLSIVYSLALFAVVFIGYQSWNMHFAQVSTLTRDIRPYEYGLVQILSGQDPFFNELFAEMTDMLFVNQLVVFGTIIEMVAVFTVIPIIISFFFGDKKRTARVIIFSLIMCTGFFVYYYFHTYCYTATMPHSTRLLSYSRYIASYPIGWMISLVGILLSGLGELRFSYFKLAGGVITIFMLFAAFVYYCPVEPDKYLFTSPCLTTDMGELRVFLKSKANAFKKLTNEDRIYFLCQKSEGGEAFIFNYEMMPAYTVDMIGGGNFVPYGETGTTIYDVEVTPEEFEAYIIEQDVDLVFVLKTDQYIINDFAYLFSDNLAARLDNMVFMYYVAKTEEGHVRLMPVGSTDNYRQLQMQHEG